LDKLAARRRAILCVLASSACFTVSSALVKTVGAAFPVAEVMLFRSLVAATVLLPPLLHAGGLAALRVRRISSHVVRTLLGFGGMATSFYGLAHLPLATNTALGFVMPLLLTLLSIPLLGEHVGWRRMAAVLAGLFGVLVMVRPWTSTSGLPLVPTLVVLGGVLCWALAMITIRKMGESGERNTSIVLWFSIGSSALAAVLVVPVWVTPAGWELAALCGVGVVSAVAQVFMTEAYRSGESSVIAPFEYGAIVYTTAMGMLIWGEFPDGWTWAGIAIIVAAGLYVWWREAVLSRVAAAVA
jgi:drug/metabolite transporter (DMT)-like permease